jgi:hypothetical protein
MRGLRCRLTYANVMASIAVFVSLGGGAYAATELPRNSVGTAAIRNGAVTTRNLANGTVTAEKVAAGSLTGHQIDVTQLGTVPSAGHASTADSATTATNASHATTADSATTAGTANSATTATNADHATTSDSATNASTLDGLAPSALQSRVSGACASNTALTQIHSDGSVSCTNVGSNTQTYAARVVSPLLSSASSTLLTIPGFAHIRVYECSSNQAAAVLVNDDNADLWFENSSEADYNGSTWSTSTTSQEPEDSITWHLGVGTGTGAEVANVNVSYAALGTSCVFQVTAEVFTAAT